MQKLYTITREEKRELNKVSEILTLAEGLSFRANNEEEEYTVEDMKRFFAEIEHWTSKAEKTLRAIIAGCYDNEVHSLAGFELDK